MMILKLINKSRFLLIIACIFLTLTKLYAETTASQLEPPSKITRKYLFGEDKQPEKAMVMLKEWLEANRHSLGENIKLRFEFSRIAGAYERVEGTEAAREFLHKELLLSSHPKVCYMINEQLAVISMRSKEWDLAVQYWQAAKESITEETDPYFIARHVLPLLEIGKIYKSIGKLDQAVEYFVKYSQSKYGRKHNAGIIEYLGDIYKARGEWKKARVLYEHYYETYKKQNWSSRDSKNKELKKIKKLIDGISEEKMQTAELIASQLKDEDWFIRRKAFLELNDLLAKTGNSEDWLLWIKHYLKESDDDYVRQAFQTLQQYLLPPTTLNSRYEKSELNTVIIEKEHIAAKFYQNLLDLVTQQDEKIKNYVERLNPITSQVLFIGDLCQDKEYHGLLEQCYEEVRKNFLDTQKAGDIPTNFYNFENKENWQKAKSIMQSSASIQDLLRKIVAQQNTYLGQALVLLYSLGDKSDIPFIIDHIPDSAHRRNYMFFSLVFNLYRYGGIDVPEIMGVGSQPYLDWWKISMDPEELRNRWRTWWEKEKDTFSYTERHRLGKRLFSGIIFSGITAIVPAPEINGIFWLWEGGRDYSARIHYFDFDDETTAKVMYEDSNGYRNQSGQWSFPSRGKVNGIRWNAQEKRLEFGIEFNLFGGTFEGGELKNITPIEGDFFKSTFYYKMIQAYGDQTFELRAGDLFLVNEKTAQEKPLITYGFILSYFLSRDLKKALIVDRDVMEKSLRLEKFE